MTFSDIEVDYGEIHSDIEEEILEEMGEDAKGEREFFLFEQVRDALKQFNGNVTKASKAVGVSRSTFYKVMQDWNISKDFY